MLSFTAAFWLMETSGKKRKSAIYGLLSFQTILLIATLILIGIISILLTQSFSSGLLTYQLNSLEYPISFLSDGTAVTLQIVFTCWLLIYLPLLIFLSRIFLLILFKIRCQVFSIVCFIIINITCISATTFFTNLQTFNNPWFFLSTVNPFVSDILTIPGILTRGLFIFVLILLSEYCLLNSSNKLKIY